MDDFVDFFSNDGLMEQEAPFISDSNKSDNNVDDAETLIHRNQLDTTHSVSTISSQQMKNVKVPPDQLRHYFSEAAMPLFPPTFLHFPVVRRPQRSMIGPEVFNFPINPKGLGFFPSNFWQQERTTLGNVITQFFRKKNHANARFLYKLYNALKITENYPHLTRHIGVSWFDDNIIRVEKLAFAELLDLKTADNSLFHQQGNFPSHGFIELNKGEMRQNYPDACIDDINFDSVRLLIHQGGIFVRGVTEENLNRCKWSRK